MRILVFPGAPAEGTLVGDDGVAVAFAALVEAVPSRQ